jgi:hypothetical protein
MRATPAARAPISGVRWWLVVMVVMVIALRARPASPAS